MKCWIIEAGAYSDYCVVGIFTTRENAEAALAYLNAGKRSSYQEPSIDERILDPSIAELNEGLIGFRVVFQHTSSHAHVARAYEVESEDGHWKGGDLYYVWARDEQHAMKIAAEKHAAWQVRGELT